MLGLLASGSALSCVLGCDVLSDRSTKELVGGYCLVIMLETKVYSVEGCPESRRQYEDIFHGEVEQIGWNESAIVGSRISMHGDQEWMTLDLRTGVVTGPIRNALMMDRLENDRQLQGITIRKVDDVLE